MTSSESLESTRNVYDTCDPHYLRELREASGMDWSVLARKACLSVAQVRQLESSDSDNLFYSDAIKRQAYKRLLMILGAEPPSVQIPQALQDAHQVARAHLDTLDQIVAMSHLPRMNASVSDTMSVLWHRILMHKQALASTLLLLFAVGLFVLYGPQSDFSQETVEAVSPPKPAAVVASAEVVAPVLPSASVASAPSPVVVASAAAVVAPIPALVASSVVKPVALPASAPASVAAVAAASAPAANKPGACAFFNGDLPQFSSAFAQKEGRYVYFVSSGNAEVCVVDGNKQATLLQLKSGENRSVYGPSPWQVSGTGLQKVQIYFQGGRVVLPEAASHRVKLVEAPLSR